MTYLEDGAVDGDSENLENGLGSGDVVQGSNDLQSRRFGDDGSDDGAGNEFGYVVQC